MDNKGTYNQFKALLGQALLYIAFTVTVLLRPELSLANAQCAERLFADNVQTVSKLPDTEAKLNQAIQKLATKMDEFLALPDMPSSYIHGELETFPRIKWINKNTQEVAKEIPFDYYTKIYNLEKAAKSSIKKEREQALLELATEYLRGENVEAAIISLMRAKRLDITEVLIAKIKYPVPSGSNAHTPRNGLGFYFEMLRDDRGYYIKELSEVLTEAFDAYWNELELRAKRLVKSINPKDQAEGKKLYSKIAEEYLENKMYQEAIWTFRRAGQFKRAAQLKEELVHILLNDPLTLTKDKLGGITQSKVYSLAPGIKVIAKIQTGVTQGNQNPESEYLAYQVSELMEMDAVSTTVLRRINGKVTSLQVLVRENSSYQRWIPKHREDINAAMANMDVFDYLIANQDRYNHMGAHNQFLRYGDNQVLIDHGIAFKAKLIARHLPFLKNTNTNKDVINDEQHSLKKQMPTEEFIQTLKNLGRPEQNEKLKDILGGVLSVDYQVFEHRRKEVLKAIQEIQNER